MKKNKLIIGVSLATIIIVLNVTILVISIKNKSLLNDSETTKQIVKDVKEISVHLKKPYYHGKILRNINDINLTKKLSLYKDDFTGYTTNNNFNRLLNAIELRNGDSLILKIPKSKIDNWQNYIRWVDTLSTKGFNLEDQKLDFIKKDNKWISKARLNYLNIKDIDGRLFNNNNACFSKELYNSLTISEKTTVQSLLQPSFYDFVTNNEESRSDVNDLEQLTNDEWERAKKYGMGGFFKCLQKVKEGEVTVKKIDSTTLEFTYDGWTDYRFLNNNQLSRAKYVMNYSFLQVKDLEKDWNFISGIMFSNLDVVKYVHSNELTNFDVSVQKSSSLFSKYDVDSSQDIDSIWKSIIQATYSGNHKDDTNSFYCGHFECLPEKNEYKRLDGIFAGIYESSNYYDESYFYKWLRE